MDVTHFRSHFGSSYHVQYLAPPSLQPRLKSSDLVDMGPISRATVSYSFDGSLHDTRPTDDVFSDMYPFLLMISLQTRIRSFSFVATHLLHSVLGVRPN